MTRTNGTQGNSFANILIGYGDTGTIKVQPAVADLSRETAFYALDNWKVTPKLTLNLGLRYEWSTPYTERHNLEQFSDFTCEQRQSTGPRCWDAPRGDYDLRLQRAAHYPRGPQ